MKIRCAREVVFLASVSSEREKREEFASGQRANGGLPVLTKCRNRIASQETFRKNAVHPFFLCVESASLALSRCSALSRPSPLPLRCSRLYSFDSTDEILRKGRYPACVRLSFLFALSSRGGQRKGIASGQRANGGLPALRKCGNRIASEETFRKNAVHPTKRARVRSVGVPRMRPRFRHRSRKRRKAFLFLLPPRYTLTYRALLHE